MNGLRGVWLSYRKEELSGDYMCLMITMSLFVFNLYDLLFEPCNVIQQL